MAIKYRYEKFNLAVDNSSQLELIAWDSNNDTEQCFITIDFPAGVTVNQIESKITQVMNYIKQLKRTEPV